MTERWKQFIVKSAAHAKDVAIALFGIQEGEDSVTAATRVGNFAARRIAYLVADYWLMVTGAALFVALKAIGIEFLWVFVALWLYDVAVAAAFLVVWQRTGVDITLGEDFRRAVNSIHEKSRLAGCFAFAVVLVEATVWTGPEHILIFFQKEIGTRRRMIFFLVALTALQALLWAALYSLGYEAAEELFTFIRNNWLF